MSEREHGLPEFLIASDATLEREFIIHTVAPRFIAEILGDVERLDPHWIDDVDDIELPEVKSLMAEAAKFYLDSMQRQAGNN